MTAIKDFLFFYSIIYFAVVNNICLYIGCRINQLLPFLTITYNMEVYRFIQISNHTANSRNINNIVN